MQTTLELPDGQRSIPLYERKLRVAQGSEGVDRPTSGVERSMSSLEISVE